jgi:hypothetical protein
LHKGAGEQEVVVLLVVYSAYGVTAVGLVTWLAHTLYANGSLFLEDVFPGREQLAAAVNRLLVTGFVMLNLGWAALLLRSGAPEDGAAAVEALALKLGLLLVTLAALHFVNLGVLAMVRSQQRRRHQLPVHPDLWVGAS